MQRSSDVAMANSINKIQYVALQMMVAKTTGLTPGKFCHMVQNAHIYDRHVDSINEMIARPGQEDAEQIRLVLKAEHNDFYKFTIDDFELQNYKPNTPNFKLEIAI